MKKLTALSAVTFGLLCSRASAEGSLAFVYLEEKVAVYESRLQECLLMGRNANLPSEAVLTALKAYPQKDAERFLLVRATLAEEKCSSTEQGELAAALLVIEAGESPVPEDAATLVEQIKPAAFPSTRWALRRHYFSLPAEMRVHLEGFEVFQRPFNSLLIREYLFD
ncbi:hypothetical protein ACBQ16_03435 [Halopseudomonas bauzanensis]|uniref:hypothetical protein n=1 Tax=Halopseudomonas bauzanensis TaxID=653930 RepID=UPI003523CB02